MFYILIIVCFFVCVIWKICFNEKRVNEPPDLSGRLPIIGHSHRILKLSDSIKVFQEFYDITEECMAKGGVITAQFGLRKVFVIADPEDCLTISNACLEKEEVYTLMKPFLGNGLLISSVPTWKKHHKLLNPVFAQPVLNSFMETFNSQARLLVEMFARKVGEPFDHEILLRLNNLETTCLTATGTGGEEYSSLQRQYVPLFSKVLNIFTVRLKRVWLHKDFIFNMSKLKKDSDEAIQALFDLSNKIIQIKKADIKNYENRPEKNKPGKLKPFLELILNLVNETGCFTDQEVREETDNIIAAGHETTASILTMAFALLGTHSDIQRNVYDEIIEVIGSTDTDVDKDDLSKLVYTEAVLKETMRLYPIAPLIARYAEKAVKLKNYTVEANTGCFLMISGVHRHPMWGPDADQFRPERWLEPATLPDPSYFGGFGLGRRSCIGKIYAMMTMKTVVAHVVRCYRISADVTNMVLKWDVVTRPASGHEITLEIRKDYEKSKLD